jgi:putative restriction endonuclease
MSSKSERYKELILATKRGQNRGIYSNAKPVYVLAIMEAVSDGIIIGNKILPDNQELKQLYEQAFARSQSGGDSLYKANGNITPFFMPFFHLNAEPYYHIKWKEGVLPPQQAKSPSIKYLKEHMEYAYLDSDLWELLQDYKVRLEYEEAIIKQFIEKENI